MTERPTNSGKQECLKKEKKGYVFFLTITFFLFLFKPVGEYQQKQESKWKTNKAKANMTTYTLDNEKKNLLYWSIQNTSEFTSQADLKYIIQYQLLSVNFHYHGHQLEHIYSKERGETEMHWYNNNSNDIQQELLNSWRKEKL